MRFENHTSNRAIRSGILFAAMVGIVFLISCAAGSRSSSAPPVPFVGTIWEWVGTAQTAGGIIMTPNPGDYTITFNEDNTFTGQADCNRIAGTYTVQDDVLNIKLGPSTLAACPPGSLDSQFTTQLAAASSWLANPIDLVILLQDRAGGMQFRASGSVPTQPTLIPVTVIPTAVPGAPTATAGPTTAATAVPTAAPPTNTPPPQCPGAPQVQSFLAEPATIVRGQNSVLRWGTVTNATSIAIDQGIGAVAAPGSTIVGPTQTTTYTMTVVGCGGQVQVSTTVTVAEPTAPPTAVPPTAVPATAVPPTAVPPTAVPPTAVPPTAVPPTAEPPTPVPPTAVPPTAAPTEVPPTQPSAPALLGPWRWLSTRLQDGTTVQVPDPNQYTIIFSPDGNAAIKADCNSGSAHWSVSGNQLSIVIGAMTQAICSPESLSNKYIAWLGAAANYNVQEPNLTIVLKADAGNMNFSR